MEALVDNCPNLVSIDLSHVSVSSFCFLVFKLNVIVHVIVLFLCLIIRVMHRQPVQFLSIQ